ncbi:hypothetical protein F4774DRAFT_411750 [Daldinia eschscholtzii]|nr:hypothetical protein F4774DRAFT_411750 [Daldinia eschscholtzii]
MRFPFVLFLLAVLGLADCLVDTVSPIDEANVSWYPRETGIILGASQTTWVPKTTPAPSGVVYGDGRGIVLEARNATKEAWVNDHTCGWMSGASSQPFVCGDDYTCATNAQNIVACVSGTSSSFYSACIGFSAFQANGCGNPDSGAGCCTNSHYGSCATYFWTGQPVRSMYRCSNVSTVVTMLDAPEYIVDATLTGSAVSTPTNSDPLATGVYPGSEQPPADNDHTPSIGIIMASVIGAILGVLIFGFFIYSFLSVRRRAVRDHFGIRNRIDDVFRPPPPFPRVDGHGAILSNIHHGAPNTPIQAPPQVYAASSVYSQDSTAPILASRRTSAPAYLSTASGSPRTPTRRSTSTRDRYSLGHSSPPGYEWHEMNVRVRPESTPAHGFSTPPPRYSRYPAIQIRLADADVASIADERIRTLEQDAENAVMWAHALEEQEEGTTTGSLSEAEDAADEVRDLK